ncbi:MAG: tRNA preQ1(34) S-adenosylmethionine ribosyltransferase-isomerase QueA [Acidimicrobiales bacterium]|jgi:S-adenosylmethionine:tRNA ribosyltransferase-isomerase
MDTASLHYDLPDGAIAQVPAEPRDSARLLVAAGGPIFHRSVADLPDLLEPGDLLVVNDTRVIPARLHLFKPSGGAVEVLLLHRRAEGGWEALVRPGRRVAPGTVLHAPGPHGGASVGSPVLEVGPPQGDDGRRLVRFEGSDQASEQQWLADLGEVPLPPYLHTPLTDPERYQTVFAQRPGSVAAPTAGLHLTDDVLERCEARGVKLLRVELVVGLGTFRPITVDRVEDHPMHIERYRIPPATVVALRDRSAASGRVVAVGTTTVRALESFAATGETEGDTDLFIHGDYSFGLVDRLMTNFHVPRSSLLAMVEAFAGPGWRDLYAVALAEGYRFLSFGDAMVVDKGALRAGVEIEEAMVEGG